MLPSQQDIHTYGPSLKGLGRKEIAMYSDRLYDGDGDPILQLSNAYELYPASGRLIVSSLPLSAGKYEWEKKF